MDKYYYMACYAVVIGGAILAITMKLLTLVG